MDARERVSVIRKFSSSGNTIVFIHKFPSIRATQLARTLLMPNMVGGDILCVYEISSPPQLSFYNPDGSEAEICGNSLICFGAILRDEGFTGLVEVYTKAGTKRIKISDNSIEAEMLNLDHFSAEYIALHLDSGIIRGYYTESVGNPHFIMIGATVPFELAPRIEKAPYFKNRVNVSFVTRISKSFVLHRIWERGVGETLSCASGAVSSFALLYSKGFVNRSCIFMARGGYLTLQIISNTIWVKGVPTLISERHYDIADIA